MRQVLDFIKKILSDSELLYILTDDGPLAKIFRTDDLVRNFKSFILGKERGTMVDAFTFLRDSS